MNNKIIVNGCSFTNGNFDLTNGGSETWANVIRDKFSFTEDVFFENIGWKGNSNDVIIPQTLEHIKNLNTDDNIIVVIQLTALDRIVVNGKKSPTVTSFLKSLNWMNWAMSQDEPVDSWWQNYFTNEYSEEKHINSLLNHLLNFQTEIKKHKNVQYKIFCGWDIFTQNTGKSSMWDLKMKYTNINDQLVTNLYESSQKLFGKLDLEKFWFFNNKHVHYGGLSQWVQYNVDNEHWYRNVNTNPVDYHPSDYAHERFADKVMIPMVMDMIKNGGK